MTIKEAIQKVIQGIDLTEDEMTNVFDQIMSGETSDAQIGSFLTALTMRMAMLRSILRPQTGP